MTEESAVSGFANRYLIDETRFGITRKSVDALPVIDVEALVFGGTEAQINMAADAMRDACINSGFFYITGYGISDAEMRKVAGKAIEFFQLPLNVKMSAHSNDFTAARGYQPINSEKITPGYEPDYKEYYDFGLELEDLSLDAVDRGVTAWPDESALTGFRALMSSHARRTCTIGQKVIRGFARALDLPDSYFDASHNPPFFNFRPSYYPPAKDVLKRNLWSCGPHTDYMSMTMLWQDEVGGLEVLNLDGNWIDATPILGALRGAASAVPLVQSGNWTGWQPAQIFGSDLKGRTLGIFGGGRIGAATARRAAAFGMRVAYHSRRMNADLDALGAVYMQDFDDFLGQIDVLSLHAPSTAQTRNIIDGGALAKMSSGSFLINTARGDLVDDDAVIAALSSGHLAAIGFDVFRGEPEFDRRYLGLPNAFILPHIGSATHETRQAMGESVIASLSTFFAEDAR